MTRFFIIGLAIIVGFGSVWVAVSKYQSARTAAVLLERENAWQKEKDLLASQLREAQAQLAKGKEDSSRTEFVEVTKKQSPQEIIGILKTLRIDSKETKNIRLAIQQLENLIELGASARHNGH